MYISCCDKFCYDSYVTDTSSGDDESCSAGEVEMLFQTSPVLLVHHGAKQGRGIVVRGVEHIYSSQSLS